MLLGPSETFLIDFHVKHGPSHNDACIKHGNFMQYGARYAPWLVSMTVNDVIIKSDVRVVSGI